jgi:hypothetical protein
MTGLPQKGTPSIRLDKCHLCDGTGKDDHNHDCKKCDGSGKLPPHKVSWKEKEKRIEQLATVIGKTPLKKHEIRAFCCNEWNLGWRQSDRYTAWAREYIVQQANRPKEEFRSEAVAWCDNVMRDPKSSEFARLRAFAERSKILGIYAPIGMRVADEQGKPLAAAVIAPIVNYICPSNGREIVPPTSGSGSANGNGAVEVAGNGNGHEERK